MTECTKDRLWLGAALIGKVEDFGLNSETLIGWARLFSLFK